MTRDRNFVATLWLSLGLLMLAVALAACSYARGQSLSDCPAIKGPCASYPWVDGIVGTAGEAKLLEYLRIFGHVAIHAHYESQAAFLARVDKLRPGLPVCLALSPYGPKIEPDNWTDPETKLVWKKRPVWAADTDTGRAVADNGEVLTRWSKRLAGRKVTLLIDLERWNLDGDADPRSPVGAPRDRWSALMGQVSTQFPQLDRLVIYGWKDRWFHASQNTAAAIFGYWKPTQYWPADFTANSEPGPVCYYGATAEGRAWTALRLNRVRMDAPSRRPWAHVQLVGQWPLSGGSFRRGVVWTEADIEALGATFRAAEAVPVFWGDVGSDTFGAQLPAFVRGLNSDSR